MKKLGLILFIIVDLAVIGAGVMYIVAHLGRRLGEKRPMAPALPLPKPMAPVTASTATVAVSSPPAAPSAAIPSGPVSPTRHIKFAYHNPRAHSVMMRADFTSWKTEPMKKEAGGTWTYVAALQPGDYAYVFIVDNHSIRDPNNKHTKQVEKAVVSSVTVRPLTAAPAAPQPASAAPH